MFLISLSVFLFFFVGMETTNETFETTLREDENNVLTTVISVQLNVTEGSHFTNHSLIRNNNNNNETMLKNISAFLNHSAHENEINDIYVNNISVHNAVNKSSINLMTRENVTEQFNKSKNNSGTTFDILSYNFTGSFKGKKFDRIMKNVRLKIENKNNKIDITANEILPKSSTHLIINKSNPSSNSSDSENLNKTDTKFQRIGVTPPINKVAEKFNQTVNSSILDIQSSETITKIDDISTNDTSENSTEDETSLEEEKKPIAMPIMVPKKTPQSLPLENDATEINFSGYVDEKLQKWYRNAKGRIKIAFEKSDLSILSLEDISNIPERLWKRINDTLLSTLTTPQIKAVLPILKVKNESATCLRILGSGVRNTLSIEEYLEEVETLNANSLIKVKVILRPLLEKLGSPENWDPTIISQLGFYILYLPKDQLAQIQNKPLMQEMITMYENIIDRNSHDPASVFLKIHMRSALRGFLLTLYGKLSDWKESDIKRNARHLPVFSPVELIDLNTNIVAEIKDYLSNIDFQDRAHAQPILKKIFDKNQVFTKDADFVLFLKKLNQLEKFVSFMDIMNPLLKILTSTKGHSLTEYLKRHLTTTEEALLGQFLYEYSYVSTTSATEMYKNVGRYLPYVGPDNIRSLAEQNLLHKYSLEQIGRGPSLEKGLILLLKNKISEFFVNKRTKNFELHLLTDGLVPVVSDEELEPIHEADVQKNIAKFNHIAPSLTMAQKIQVVNKIEKKDFVVPEFHPAFMSLVSPAQLKDLPTERLENFLNSMPPESPQIQLYMQNKYQNKRLTLNDLRESPKLIGAMTISMIRSLNPDDIFESLLTINESPIPPRPKVVKYLASVLKEYLQNSTGSNHTDDIELLRSLKDGEMELVGGQILAEFSTKALTEFPSKRCSVLFSIIGRLPPERLLNIQPPEKRNTIAKTAFECLERKSDDQPLNLADIESLGYLIIYLSSQVLSLMDPTVFVAALPYLQGISVEATNFQDSFNSFVPCYNNGMKTAIREKIIEVFGHPLNWTEATLWSLGCLLTTLEPKDVFEPALLYQIKQITTSCSWTGNKEMSQRAWEELYREQCEKKTELEMNVISDGVSGLKRQFTRAAMEYAPLYSSDRRKREKKPYPNHFNLTCNGIRMTGGVFKMIPNELEKLDIRQLQHCLDKLGEMSWTEEESSILWTQIKKTYGTITGLPPDILLQLGQIARAMTPDEMSRLILDDFDVIASLGKVKGFTSEQLEELARQAKAGIKKPVSEYSRHDVISLGYILCGYDPVDLTDLPVISYREASVAIGYLFPCSEEVLSDLAVKATDAFGDPSEWNSAILTTVGSVIGGLAPEQLFTIPSDAFEGLTRAGALSLVPNSLKTLKTDQLSSFSVEGALSLTEQQMAHLSKEQKDALKSVYIAPGDGSSKKGILAKSIILLFTFPLLLYHFSGM